MKVINNILNKEKFLKFKEIMFSDDLAWYFKKNMTYKDNYFFNHCFYTKNKIRSEFLFNEYIKDILDKINCVAIIGIRANLMLRKKKVYQSNYHIDRPEKCKTAVLYMNTCNGYTVIDKNNPIKIKSEENKIIIFDSNILHKAISQTDCERRIVINFNYFENGNKKK